MAELRVSLRVDAVKYLIRRERLTNERVAREMRIARDLLQRIFRGDRDCSWETPLRLAAVLRVAPTTIAQVSCPGTDRAVS